MGKREELDAQLDQEYQAILKSMEEPEVTTEDKPIVEDETDEEGVELEESTDESEVEDDEELEEDKPQKRTKEEKKEYAFAQLRKEKSDAKKALDDMEKNYKEQQDVLNRLMKEAGYNNYNEFKDAVDSQLSQKEMKDKGYTKENYDELVNLRLEKEKLKQELDSSRQRTYTEKVNQFDSLVKDYAKRASTTSVSIYNQLEELGYTVETLLAQPNPEILIKGLVADKLSPTPTVTKVKRSVDTEKPQSGGASSSDEINFDELVKQEMAEYKQRKGKA